MSSQRVDSSGRKKIYFSYIKMNTVLLTFPSNDAEPCNCRLFGCINLIGRIFFSLFD